MRVTSLLFLTTVSLACACDHAPPDEGEPMSTMQRLRAACPTLLPGTRVDIARIEDGVALSFTTDAADIEDLRTRAERMADQYRHHRGSESLSWHHMPNIMMRQRPIDPGVHPARGELPMMAAVEVKEIHRGARVELVPDDPAEARDLWHHVRNHHDRLVSGQCWIVDEVSTNDSRS